MPFYTLTPGAPTSASYPHTGGTLEVVIAEDSVFGAGAEIKIQFETATSSGVYKNIPLTDIKSLKLPDSYELSAGNYRFQLVGGQSNTSIGLRVTSVA